MIHLLALAFLVGMAILFERMIISHFGESKMTATIIIITDGVITVKVNRSGKIVDLYQRNYDLRVGEKIIVRRQTNNPYLIFVNKVTK